MVLFERNAVFNLMHHINHSSIVRIVRGSVVDLMNPVDNVVVQYLLLVVVLGGVHFLVPQPGVFPDLLQGVVLHKAAVLKNSHQHVLQGAQINHQLQQDDG